MTLYARKTKFNKKCAQQLFTATCGQHCIYYIVWRCRGVYMKDILKKLDENYADEFVTGFVNSLFKIYTNVIADEFIINQICNKYGTILHNIA